MVAFRDKLGTDHDVDAALRDVPEFLTYALDRRDEIAGEHENTPVGEERMRLFLEPLHAGPAGYKRVRRVALGAGGRWRGADGAVMRDKLALETVVDQPRVALRALQTKSARAAKRKRRIAAAVEKQERLIAALQRGLHDAGKPRRDEAAARRTFALQINRLDRRLRLPAEALGQGELPVASAPCVDHRLDGGRRGREHDRDVGDARAHHRHVARVIVYAVFLLVDGIVFFIDDDQAEVGVRQEQRRARADQDIHLAGRDRIPGARALACAKLRMPLGRAHAETQRKTIQKLRRERYLGHQDQRLAPLADRRWPRLETTFDL